jgi:hypothetical protein
MLASATLEDFDARIHVLERELAALKTKRNSLLPIHRLPPEIVADVFKLAQHGCRSVDETAPWENYDSSWCDIMLVCRRFREVAVHTPALWIMVDYRTHPPDWRALCMHRSSHLPLCVRNPTRGSLTILPRAQTLEIRNRMVADEILDVPMPALHALRIALNKSANEEEYLYLNKMSHYSPALAYIGLTNVPLDALPPLHSLRRLELISVVVGEGLDGLFELLSQVASVEVLCLRSVDFNGVEPLRDLEKTHVSLPCLRSLLVDDAPKSVESYLRVLPLPTLALVISACCVFDESDSTQNALTCILNTWFRFARSTPDSSSLVHGTLKYSELINTVDFKLGDGQMVDNIRQFGTQSSPSFCEIAFSAATRIGDPVTPYIHTLHLVMSPPFDIYARVSNLNIVCYPHVLPNLQCIVLEGFVSEPAHPKAMTAVCGYFSRFGSSVQRVRFVNCLPGMKSFVNELEEEHLVATVDWEPEPHCDGASDESTVDSAPSR